MPLATCRRCGGNGHYTDQNPTRHGVHDWCAGCEGEGQADVPFPEELCKRCSGTGRYTDQNPTRPGVYDWCDGCGGTGYAW